MSSSSKPFTRAYDNVWEQLTLKERKDLAGYRSVKDVHEVTREVQEKQGKKGRLRNLLKIEPYLDKLDRYAKVIAIFVSAKPEILALIWVCLLSCQ